MTRKIKFSWWGGVVGPGIMNLMKCESCGCQFNGKTGRPALKAIVAYNVVIYLLMLVVVLWLFAH
ncbi:MAG: hypothetical protein ACHQ50_06865 [Fimbriimonadales bacterium]